VKKSYVRKHLSTIKKFFLKLFYMFWH